MPIAVIRHPLLALAIFVAGTCTVGAEWLDYRGDMMGTELHMVVWHTDREAGEDAMNAVVADMERLNRAMSPHIADSALSRVNAVAARQPVSVSEEMLTLLQHAHRVSELTNGAFDITYASVGHLYDYRQGVKPEAETVEQRLAAIDYRHVQLDRAAGTVTLTRPGVRIDLGGIAKGYAVERAAAILKEHGIAHAQISLGGDTRLVGDHRGRPWMIGVRHPRDADKTAVRMPLSDEAISTSGDYERYFEDGGIRYHHIIDPDTGRSPDAVHSVTIVGPDATRTDAFSTSVFVLGIERGMAFIDSQPAFEAIIMDSQGKLYYSTGLQPPGETDN